MAVRCRVRLSLQSLLRLFLVFIFIIGVGVSTPSDAAAGPTAWSMSRTELLNSYARRQGFLSWNDYLRFRRKQIVARRLGLRLTRPSTAPAKPAAKSYVLRANRNITAALRRQIRLSEKYYPDSLLEEAVIEALGGSIRHAFRGALEGSYGVMAEDVSGLRAFNRRQKLFRLGQSPRVRIRAVPNDPLFLTSQWGLRNTGQSGGTAGIDIRAVPAWDISTGTNQMVAAIIDSGIDPTHPDLAPNLWVNPGETPGDSIDNDLNGYVDDVFGANVLNHSGDVSDFVGHGTAVAGVLAARGNNSAGMSGVSWNSRILPIVAVAPDGTDDLTSVIMGIEYAVDLKNRFDDQDPTNHGADIRVINLSLGAFGTSCDPGVDPAIDLFIDAVFSASDAGILIVTAASNSAQDHDVFPDVPGSCWLPNIINVAGIDPDGELWCGVRRNPNGSCPPGNGSSYGFGSVHIAAPAEDIVSTMPTQIIPAQYASQTGNSLAAPHVAGAAMLMFAVDPELWAEDVWGLLVSTARLLPGLEFKVLSEGMLDAAAAVSAAAGSSSAEITYTGEIGILGDWDTQSIDDVFYTNAFATSEVRAFVIGIDGDGNHVRLEVKSGPGVFDADTGILTVPAHDHGEFVVTLGPESGPGANKEVRITIVLTGDLTGDGCVKFDDFAWFAFFFNQDITDFINPWLEGDFDHNGKTFFSDFAYFAPNFLDCGGPTFVGLGSV